MKREICVLGKQQSSVLITVSNEREPHNLVVTKKFPSHSRLIPTKGDAPIFYKIVPKRRYSAYINFEF